MTADDHAERVEAAEPAPTGWPGSAVDDLIAQAFPSISPKTVRLILGWPPSPPPAPPTQKGPRR